MAAIFWDKHEATSFTFQESQLLNIIIDYLQNMYYKLFCYTFFLREKEYI